MGLTDMIPTLVVSIDAVSIDAVSVSYALGVSLQPL